MFNPRDNAPRLRLRARDAAWAAALAAGLALAAGDGAVRAQPAKFAFGKAGKPTADAAGAHGRYAAGCLSGGTRLPETGPGWQAMRLSRNRNWGHPSVILFIKRLSRAAREAGWAGLYVGDISQPRGGPMTSGHRSHQIGLDVDIWLRPPDSLKLSRVERERISSTSVVARNRLRVNGRWTESHSRVLEAAAKDESVARIFVNAAIKRRLCKARTGDDAEWLRKVRPWWGHTTHFHVRLRCPGNKACVEQAPLPEGDGCDRTLAWWFTGEALYPPPADPLDRRPELTLADLPPVCRAVLKAR